VAVPASEIGVRAASGRTTVRVDEQRIRRPEVWLGGKSYGAQTMVRPPESWRTRGTVLRIRRAVALPRLCRGYDARNLPASIS